MHANHKATEQYSRLSCRISTRIKDRAEQAAALTGQSMTDFTESALADKAQTVLDQYDRLLLSERDFAKFVAAIEAPEAPTAALKKAMAEYEQLRLSHPESNL